MAIVHRILCSDYDATWPTTSELYEILSTIDASVVAKPEILLGGERAPMWLDLHGSSATSRGFIFRAALAHNIIHTPLLDFLLPRG